MFKDMGIQFESIFKRVVSNSDNTLYWKDYWCGDSTLKYAYPNLYNVEKKNDYLLKESF